MNPTCSGCGKPPHAGGCKLTASSSAAPSAEETQRRVDYLASDEFKRERAASLAGRNPAADEARLDWQAMVREFHVALDHGIGETPAIRNAGLRAALIEEEADETCDALRRRDLVEVVDGLCDIIYVAIGCAIECGIDLAPFFAEVHRSNMAKVGGPLREDGKRLKPPGWTPPDIAGLLAKAGT